MPTRPPDRATRPASPTRPALLADLVAAGLDVFCWCNRCSHNSVLSAAMLQARLGPRTPVPRVAERLRCTSCGAADVISRPAWPSLGPVSRHTA